jgi:hypothetical protein
LASAVLRAVGRKNPKMPRRYRGPMRSISRQIAAS